MLRLVVVMLVEATVALEEGVVMVVESDTQLRPRLELGLHASPRP